MKLAGVKDASKEGRRGFLQLGAVNAGVALLGLLLMPYLGWILVTFPVLQLAWSLPWTVVAEVRGHHDYASGLKVALGLSSLAGCVCWGIACWAWL